MAYTIDYWRRQKIIKEQQRRNQKSKNDRIKSEISELEKAYNKVAQLKNQANVSASTIRKKVKHDALAKDLKWRGKSKNDFDKKVKDGVKNAADKYYLSIDAVQDEIGRAIDSKRREYSTGIALLDGINRSLININGIIRNWFN